MNDPRNTPAPRGRGARRGWVAAVALLAALGLAERTAGAARAAAAVSPGREAGNEAPTYNRDVRPIFNENCFACHGADKAARKARLRLDVREEAIKLEAIVPGQPDKSALIERVFEHDPKKVMPPPRSQKKLT